MSDDHFGTREEMIDRYRASQRENAALRELLYDSRPFIAEHLPIKGRIERALLGRQIGPSDFSIEAMKEAFLDIAATAKAALESGHANEPMMYKLQAIHRMATAPRTNPPPSDCDGLERKIERALWALGQGSRGPLPNHAAYNLDGAIMDADRQWDDVCRTTARRVRDQIHAAIAELQADPPPTNCGSEDVTRECPHDWEGTPDGARICVICNTEQARGEWTEGHARGGVFDGVCRHRTGKCVHVGECPRAGSCLSANEEAGYIALKFKPGDRVQIVARKDSNPASTAHAGKKGRYVGIWRLNDREEPDVPYPLVVRVNRVGERCFRLDEVEPLREVGENGR